MLGTLGVFFALFLIIFLAFRGVNIVIASLVSVVVVALTNGPSVAHVLTKDFTPSMMGFAGRFLLVFLTGAIFGRLMAESKASESIAYALSRKLGDKRALLIIVLATTLLTYGGVKSFIVVFALYPLGLSLVHRANIPKRLLMAAVGLGAASFTMTAMPGVSSVHNNIAANALGTPLTAAPGLGLLASVVMFTLGMLYLEWALKRARQRNEGFVPGEHDLISEETPETISMPHWFNAILPLLAVLTTILVPNILYSVLGIRAGMGPAAGAANESASGFLGLLLFARQRPILWTSIALILGIAVGLVLFRRFLPKPHLTVGHGADSAAVPLLNMSAVIGFGGVVSTTAVFDSFSTVMHDSGLPPLVSAVFSIMVISGVVGSGSAGLAIWMPSFAQHYLDAGVPVETLHRVVTIASGTIDTLPHCGGVIICLSVMGLTHREAYKDTALVLIGPPLVATILVILLATYL